MAGLERAISHQPASATRSRRGNPPDQHTERETDFVTLVFDPLRCVVQARYSWGACACKDNAAPDKGEVD